MKFYDLIINRRTIRQYQPREVAEEILEKCVNAARLAPSARNLQPLEFIVVNEPSSRDKMFATTRWAGDLKDGRPDLGKRPVVFIIILTNNDIALPGYKYDSALAAMNIIYTLEEEGIASCIIGSLERDEIRKIFNIPDNYTIDLAIALGYPAEESAAEDVLRNESLKYYKDDKGKMHIPKRKLEDVMHKNKF